MTIRNTVIPTAGAETPGRFDTAGPAGHGPVARSSGDSLAAGSAPTPSSSPGPAIPHAWTRRAAHLRQWLVTCARALDDHTD
jgi:hypothetical protein